MEKMEKMEKSLVLKESQITRDDYEYAFTEDEYPANVVIDLDLFQSSRDGLETGQARTTTVGDDDVSILEMQDKNYRISIQRLLFADGKYHTSEGETKEATLAVMKFYIRSLTAGNGKPIRKVSTQLDFGAEDGHGPSVVGWAPFNKVHRQNASSADQTRGWSSTTSLQAGWNGISVGQDLAQNGSQSWNKTYFDEYSSSGVPVGNRLCGVSWDMTHNVLANQGVIPEFLVYILLTRTSNKPYIAKFTMDVTAGHIGGALEKLHLSWVKKKERTFHVTPNMKGPPRICVGEGAAIWEKLDMNHLERLKANYVSTGLQLPWEVEEAGQSTGEKAKVTANGNEKVGDKALVSEENSKDSQWVEREVAAKRDGGQQERSLEQGRQSERPEKPAMASAGRHGSGKERSPPVGLDSMVDTRSRLLMLETRVAQMELRCALQDVTIAQLRQELQHALSR